MSWSVGIDLGGTNMEVGLVDGSYRIADREISRTRAPRSAESLVESMVSNIHSLLQRNALDVSDLDSVGLGLPGLVDQKTGLMIEAANLALDHVDFISLLGQHFPATKIKTENDADCAVWGEYLTGEANAFESALMLTLGTGLGGGFVCDGRIFRGATGLGIEPGHIAIEVEDGPLCSCGRRGCLEMYVSIRGLNRLIQEGLRGDLPSSLRHSVKKDNPSGNVRAFFDSVRTGDRTALRILDRYVAFLAAGIRTLTVLYRPHIILLGGGISRAGGLLLEPLRKALDPEKPGDYILFLPPVAISRLGNDAGIIGAAMLHREGMSAG